eukprot:11784-Pyramimonas_sp.AAC.1
MARVAALTVGKLAARLVATALWKLLIGPIVLMVRFTPLATPLSARSPAVRSRAQSNVGLCVAHGCPRVSCGTPAQTASSQDSHDSHTSLKHHLLLPTGGRHSGHASRAD